MCRWVCLCLFFCTICVCTRLKRPSRQSAATASSSSNPLTLLSKQSDYGNISHSTACRIVALSLTRFSTLPPPQPTHLNNIMHACIVVETHFTTNVSIIIYKFKCPSIYTLTSVIKFQLFKNFKGVLCI